MKYLIIITISIILIATGCFDDKDCHSEIVIVNNSDKSIYFYRERTFPDTSIVQYNPSLTPGAYKVERNSRLGQYDDCFEAEFKRDSVWMYFIYDAHTIETEPWDTVRKYYKILKRYDLTQMDIENLDWTITYP